MAIAWTWALAGLHSVKIMPGVLPGLGLSVWMVYVLNRLLAGVGGGQTSLDLRSESHDRRFWIACVLVAAGINGWLALAVVPSGLLWECLGLGIFILLYLAVFVSREGHWFHRFLVPVISLFALIVILVLPLSAGFRLLATLLILAVLVQRIFQKKTAPVPAPLVKDVAGGLLFAIGCTSWTRFVHGGGDMVASTLEMLLLTCLFVSNLTGISSHASQGRWLAIGLGLSSGIFGLSATGRVADSLGKIALACGTGLLLLLLLERCKKHLSARAYRVWADLGVLAPVLLLWLRS